MSVHLYEDNAGGLYLWREGDREYWAGIEQAVASGGSEGFLADGEALDAGDTANWTLDSHPYGEEAFAHPETKLIALYDRGRITTVREPGRNGSAYLSLTAEAVGDLTARYERGEFGRH
jgi:hypothetical protein